MTWLSIGDLSSPGPIGAEGHRHIGVICDGCHARDFVGTRATLAWQCPWQCPWQCSFSCVFFASIAALAAGTMTFAPTAIHGRSKLLPFISFRSFHLISFGFI